eukprot:4962672-Amphidinium_carterae.1
MANSSSENLTAWSTCCTLCLSILTPSIFLPHLYQDAFIHCENTLRQAAVRRENCRKDNIHRCIKSHQQMN